VEWVTKPSIQVVLFDVNETLSDMKPLQARFEEVGAPAQLSATWFAGVLRDGFALTASGEYAAFADVASDVLRQLLAGLPDWRGDPDEATARILAGFGDLRVHPDVPDGVRRLAGSGLRLATMTNGSKAVSEGLLGRAGLLEHFTALLDVSGPRAWKPAAAAYRYALDQLGARPEETLLVAVHPWDIAGARQAGLPAAWLRRGARAYPSVMTPPTVAVDDLRELAGLLTG
jgi:2-haloacid dehalogenase